MSLNDLGDQARRDAAAAALAKTVVTLAIDLPPSKFALFLFKCWRVCSHICLIVVLALSASYGIVRLTQPAENPVSIHTLIEVETKTVPVGGELRYRFIVNRLRNCRGYVSEVFTMQGNSQEYQISVAIPPRPITNSEPGIYRRDQTTRSPPSIRGPTRYRAELVSQCPEGPKRDLIAEIDYEAVP